MSKDKLFAPAPEETRLLCVEYLECWRLPSSGDTRLSLVSTEVAVVKSIGDKQLKNHQRVGSIAILDRRRDIPWDGPALFGV